MFERQWLKSGAHDDRPLYTYKHAVLLIPTIAEDPWDHLVNKLIARRLSPMALQSDNATAFVGELTKNSCDVLR